MGCPGFEERIKPFYNQEMNESDRIGKDWLQIDGKAIGYTTFGFRQNDNDFLNNNVTIDFIFYPVGYTDILKRLCQ